MNKIIIIAAAAAALIGAVCFVSPSAKYAIKGNIKKIENRIQLENAIEILETKNLEMREKYVNLSTGIHNASLQVKKMQNLAASAKVKEPTELNLAKYAMYTNGVGHLTVAYDKMIELRGKMRENIIKHKSQIELLKAKLVYLDSLKTMNSYLKDAGIGDVTCGQITGIVEEAIIAEEAVAESMKDMETLTAELRDL